MIIAYKLSINNTVRVAEHLFYSRIRSSDFNVHDYFKTEETLRKWTKLRDANIADSVKWQAAVQSDWVGHEEDY